MAPRRTPGQSAPCQTRRMGGRLRRRPPCTKPDRLLIIKQMPSPAEDYLDKSTQLIATVSAQLEAINTAADWFAETILAGQMVHVFGSGHSRILTEEMWPRYGSFPGFNPIVELSLTFHNLVVGANGQRQAMFLENVSGLAARILRNFDLKAGDSRTGRLAAAAATSSRSRSAEEFQKRGVQRGRDHQQDPLRGQRPTRHPAREEAQRLRRPQSSTPVPHPATPWSQIEGLDTPVAPGSTIGGVLLINTIKAEVAKRLTDAGQPPKVLSGCRHRRRRDEPPNCSKPPTTNTPDAWPNTTRTSARSQNYPAPTTSNLNFNSPHARASPSKSSVKVRAKTPLSPPPCKSTPLRTSVIGSYPFPAWLEFASQQPRANSARTTSPRCRTTRTTAAIHDQLAAGLDVDHRRRADPLRLQPLVLRLPRGHRPRSRHPRARFGPPAHDQRGKHAITGELSAPGRPRRGRGIRAPQAPRPRQAPTLKASVPGPFTLSGRLLPNAQYPDRYAITEALLPIVRKRTRSPGRGRLRGDLRR